MSFPSLPPELVRQIIESSVPSSFHSTTKKERQATLRSLCLVSQLFQSIAQPLLFRTIFVNSPGDLACALASARAKEAYGMIETLVVEDKHEIWTATSAAKKLSLHASNLRTLILHFTRPKSQFRAYAIHLHPHLETLQLVSRGFDSSASYTFSRLVNLTIDDLALKNASRLLRPACLPSLRHLALPGVWAEMDLKSLKKAHLEALLPQLETITLEAALFQLLPVYLFQYIDRTLFNFNACGYATPGSIVEVCHLRVREFNSQSFAFEMIETIPELVSLIRRRNPINLRSIYLHPSLRNPANLIDELSDLTIDLLEVCQEKGVEVIYEIQPETTVDPWISDEFCKRSRMQREAEGRTVMKRC